MTFYEKVNASEAVTNFVANNSNKVLIITEEGNKTYLQNIILQNEVHCGVQHSNLCSYPIAIIHRVSLLCVQSHSTSSTHFGG